MSTGTRVPDHLRAKAIADYRNGRDSLEVVAGRHGVSKAALCDWMKPRPKRVRDDSWPEAEIALTGGQWVARGGVMRWEAA